MPHYYVMINGHANGYHNTLETIKDSLYELFGDVPIATDDTVMLSIVGGMVVRIVEIDPLTNP